MAKSIKEWNFVISLFFFLFSLCLYYLIFLSELWSNDVQIPLWNSALAKSPVSEYPPSWPAQWMPDGQKSPAIPFPATVMKA